MNELQIFKNEDFGEVRTVTIDNEPFFVGNDVAEILGYADTRSTVSRKVDEEDKGVAKLTTPSGIQEMTVINESGLYSLVLGSKLPSAKKFKRWVTKDVLPSIRKHGMYATDELLDNPDLLIQVATALKEERNRNKALVTEVKIKEQIIDELQPKASYYDLILQCSDLLSVSQIAKDYGKSARWLNSRLHDLKIQYIQGDVWLLYQKYADKGYTHSKTQNYNRPDGTQGSKLHTYWTQKGRLFLYELLKQNGVVPTIEIEEE